MPSLALRASTVALLAILSLPAPLSSAAGPFPEAVSWGPLGTDVPVGSAIEIGWSMAMNNTTVEQAFSLTDGIDVWTAGSFTWTHSPSAPYTTTAAPRFPLRSFVLYSAVVSTNATNVAGDPLDQDGDATGGEVSDHLTWTFVTEDLGLPHVDATIPQDSASGVPVGADVIVVFDEPMDAASTEAAFSMTPSLAGTFGWEVDGGTVTFSPSLNLTYGTVYAVRVRGGAEDLDGSPLDADRDGIGGDDYVFSFETESDAGPPMVVATAPVDGEGNVSVSGDIVVTFSESMNRTSVEEALALTDGNQVWTRANGTFSWGGVAFADDRMSFNPHRNLPFSAAIAATLDASVARDRAGFLLDGDGDGVAEGSPVDDVGWGFVLEAVDTLAPSVLAVSPANGATGVSPVTDVVLTFSESMNRTSVESSFRIEEGTRVWTAGNGTFAWSVGDDVLTFVSGEEFTEGAAHQVLLEVNTTRDVNGNALAGDGVVNGTFASAFTVRDAPDLTPPRVSDAIPEDGAEGVDRLPRIAITFDDAMDRGETQSSIVLTNSTGPSASTVPVRDFEWSAANHTVSFEPAVFLEWETWHQVIVTTGARNVDELPLEELFQIRFRTAKWNARVSGSVLDAAGVVEAAIVSLDGRTTQTSEDGRFAIIGIQEGEYNLTVSKAGYDTVRMVVKVSPSLLPEDSVDLDVGAIVLRRVGNPLAAIAFAGLVFGLVGVVSVALILRRRAAGDETLDDLEPDVDELGPHP